ncbi:MAG: cache domain-containing protein [Burkholderiales bacterium]|nr:cache domain-containing protein [Burkholderiales bacterium]
MNLRTRLNLLLVVMLLGLLAFGLYSALALRAHIMEEKRIALHELVDSAYGVFEQQYAQFQAGKITEDEAKQRVKDDLRKARYNKGLDYFFINDMAGNTIMNPAKPEREGKNFLDSKDPTGKAYIRDWIELLKHEPAAYMDYHYPRPDSKDHPVPKVSYARLFAPWNWWVGTGVYIDDVDAEFHSAVAALLVFLVALGGILGTFGWWVSRSVLRQIGGEPSDAVKRVSEFAEGDLTRLAVGNADMGASVLGALANMQGKLAGLVGDIRSGTAALTTESGQLSESAQAISSAAHSQAEASAKTAAAVEELTVSIAEVSEIACATEENARRTAELATSGNGVVQQATQEIRNISSSVHESSDRIQTLVQRSREIGDVTKVIKDIADQTNLLALNAAIEAARAGEQGRGFAVVADEVRKLAERTASATIEITKMVDAIQNDTVQAVEAMETVLPRVKTGQDLAQQAAALLEDIQRQARDSQGKVSNVAQATRSQAATANQIAGHVDEIAQMSQTTDQSTRNNLLAAKQLKSLAEKLQLDVSFFKT